MALPVLAMFASIMDYATFSWTRDRLQIIPMMWDQKENYAFNGFTLAFALNLPMANVPAPAGYSAEAIGDIPGFPAASVPADKPDIIIVMSESFWDPTKLPGVTITPDPIPTVRETRSGSMFSPEFGGMTANIEFEALTGFSNAFLPYGSIPYQQYIHGAAPLARHLPARARAMRRGRCIRSANGSGTAAPSIRPSASIASCRRSGCRRSPSAGCWPPTPPSPTRSSARPT